VPLAYDIHPEFGYLCPAPRARRELRVAVVSILLGMVLGAAIVTIGAGHAADTAPGNASGSDTVLSGGAGPSSQLKTAGNTKTNRVGAIEPYPMRMVRVRSGKAPSLLAGIPLGRTAPQEPDIVPAAAGPAAPENGAGPGSSERAYVEHRYRRGPYRNWVY
jgi:hypothetical protein